MLSEYITSLLTSAFMLWPPCTCGFGIQEKIQCGLQFFGVFLCGFAVFVPPLRPPPPGPVLAVILSCSTICKLIYGKSVYLPNNMK